MKIKFKVKNVVFNHNGAYRHYREHLVDPNQHFQSSCRTVFGQNGDFKILELSVPLDNKVHESSGVQQRLKCDKLAHFARLNFSGWLCMRAILLATTTKMSSPTSALQAAAVDIAKHV